MPRYIIKLDEYYLEYSTIVDAPVTRGLTLDEFKAYYLDEYGRSGSFDLHDRLQRVEATGTSARLHKSVDETLLINRAGLKESRLTKEQILDHYCRNKAQGQKPLGSFDPPDEDH